MCHWRGAILQSFLFFSMILVFCFNLHYVIFTYFTLIRSIYILGDGPIVRRPNSPKVRYSEDPIVRRSDSLKARKSEDLIVWNQNRIYFFLFQQELDKRFTPCFQAFPVNRLWRHIHYKGQIEYIIIYVHLMYISFVFHW
jgi:hypothetical protein